MSVLEDEINKQLDAWLKGIYSEIGFWSKYISEKGWIYKSKWEITTACDRRFTLEDDIPANMYGKKFDFIDVGSGPFSRCGFVTDKVELNHCAVDPLADVYKSLKSDAGIKTQVNLQTGFVELLDKVFEKNSFDLVHMSNSLDHSFDAIMGIYQLINICRIGGKIILRHKENEALVTNYEGLHQWNISVNVEDNNFVIWRNKKRIYNINNIFGEYIEIKCTHDPLEDVFNRVEMIKKKDIAIPQSNTYDVMLTKIYAYLLSVISNDVMKGVNSPKSVFIDKSLKKIASISALDLERQFVNNGWNRIAIYGLGAIGEELLSKLSETNLEITEIIDQRGLEINKRRTVSLENYNKGKKFDIIIVTVFSGFEMIKNNIINLGIEPYKIFSIDYLISEYF